MSPNYASHAVLRDTLPSNTSERIMPQGFSQNLIAKLHWLWNPQEAERRYEFKNEAIKRQPRVLRQDFEVLLLAKPGEAPVSFTTSLEAETLFAGAGWTMSAEFQLDTRRDNLLAKAGREGLMLDGAFYPHSRIDRVIPQRPQVIQEGDEEQG